ncbi:50S ribosomal protein L11 methyltransferase [Candidatus Marithrix sp. Canyon 246]|uniref:50S ribosomal protein L11 methyltransferase n=1 Tax=Candidatus Marithrix sp. Canyon 246 TaxID=1827136 RepID=UPI00084A2AC3|nr:50S ribosomal protein L11 methyltransferase [Candidatus Marithrix sp. Canyon 246]
MSWVQVILTTDQEQAEAISEELFSIGAVSVSFKDAADEPVYEPALNTTPLWGNTQVIALFEETPDLKQFSDQKYEIQILEDQEWTRVWMDDFHPMQFGERVWICPSWSEPPNPSAVNILLDPGLAFGTGTHATTALCLECLDKHHDLSGKTIIDYGSGSGVLAITAAKLGAKHIWAVDNDPQALIATADNAKKNEVNQVISCQLPEEPLPEVDIMLANILAMPLIELAPILTKHLKPQSTLILSGILKEQQDEVIAAYQAYMNTIQIVEREDWVMIELSNTL